MTVLITLLFATFAPGQISAHPTDTYFRTFWQVELSPPGHGGGFDMYFTNEWAQYWSGGWTQNWIDRAVDARDAWPWGGGDYRPLTYFKRSTGDWDYVTPCGTHLNGLHFGWSDGVNTGAFATTRYCFRTDNHQMMEAQIRFDNKEWWTNTDPRHPALLDFQSVIAHELGHAWGGWGPQGGIHFFAADTCSPDVGPRHTMCGGYEYGSGYARSPEAHDEHTADAGYPGD